MHLWRTKQIPISHQRPDGPFEAQPLQHSRTIRSVCLIADKSGPGFSSAALFFARIGFISSNYSACLQLSNSLLAHGSRIPKRSLSPQPRSQGTTLCDSRLLGVGFGGFRSGIGGGFGVLRAADSELQDAGLIWLSSPLWIGWALLDNCCYCFCLCR